MKTAHFDEKLVKHIADLANIPLNKGDATWLAEDFAKTLTIIDNLNELDLSAVEPTHQVTGLENILRDDEVDQKRSFTQEEALHNAGRTYDGYFVVDQIIEQDN